MPEEEPFGPRLNQQHAGEHNPVHQPWCELRRVAGLESLVAGEQREEEGCEGAVRTNEAAVSSSLLGIEGLFAVITHDRSLAKMSNMVTPRMRDAMCSGCFAWWKRHWRIQIRGQ